MSHESDDSNNPPENLTALQRYLAKQRVETTGPKVEAPVEPLPPPVPPPPQTPPPESLVSVEPGGFWVRFFAYWIDGLLMAGLSAPVAHLIGSYFVAVQIVTFFYAGWFYSEKGATPGKMLFGLQVVQGPNGRRIGFLRGYIRESFGKYLSALPLGLGYLVALFNRDRLTLHDIVTDTKVMRTKSPFR